MPGGVCALRHRTLLARGGGAGEQVRGAARMERCARGVGWCRCGPRPLRRWEGARSLEVCGSQLSILASPPAHPEGMCTRSSAACSTFPGAMHQPHTRDQVLRAPPFLVQYASHPHTTKCCVLHALTRRDVHLTNSSVQKPRVERGEVPAFLKDATPAGAWLHMGCPGRASRGGLRMA